MTSDDGKRWLKSLFSGGVAGIVSRTAVAPLERVKILFQVQGLSAQGAPLKHTSILKSLQSLVNAEGFAGLWKGNGANCVRVFPSSAIQFTAYGELKQRLFVGKAQLTPVDRYSLASSCNQVRAADS